MPSEEHKVSLAIMIQFRDCISVPGDPLLYLQITMRSTKLMEGGCWSEGEEIMPCW